MKRINKGPSPTFFEHYKQQNPHIVYKDLETVNKPLSNKLRKHLAKEQGDICCYCCCRIKPGSMHTEHIKPQDDYPAETMDYTNMLVSCNGFEAYKQTCGHRTEKWHHPVGYISPLDPDCESHFIYKTNGKIEGIGNAQKMVEHLNLSVTQLNQARRVIIYLVLQELEKDPDCEQELLHAYSTKDTNGQYLPFSPAAVYAIQHL